MGVLWPPWACYANRQDERDNVGMYDTLAQVETPLNNYDDLRRLVLLPLGVDAHGVVVHGRYKHDHYLGSTTEEWGPSVRCNGVEVSARFAPPGQLFLRQMVYNLGQELKRLHAECGGGAAPRRHLLERMRAARAHRRALRLYFEPMIVVVRRVFRGDARDASPVVMHSFAQLLPPGQHTVESDHTAPVVPDSTLFRRYQVQTETALETHVQLPADFAPQGFPLFEPRNPTVSLNQHSASLDSLEEVTEPMAETVAETATEPVNAGAAAMSSVLVGSSSSSVSISSLTSSSSSSHHARVKSSTAWRECSIQASLDQINRLIAATRTAEASYVHHDQHGQHDQHDQHDQSVASVAPVASATPVETITPIYARPLGFQSALTAKRIRDAAYAMRHANDTGLCKLQSEAPEDFLRATLSHFLSKSTRDECFHLPPRSAGASFPRRLPLSRNGGGRRRRTEGRPCLVIELARDVRHVRQSRI